MTNSFIDKESRKRPAKTRYLEIIYAEIRIKKSARTNKSIKIPEFCLNINRYTLETTDLINSLNKGCGQKGFDLNSG